MKITQVRLEVSYDNGESFSLVETEPGPGGDDPNFLLRQFDAALRKLSARGGMLIYANNPNQLPIE